MQSWRSETVAFYRSIRKYRCCVSRPQVRSTISDFAVFLTIMIMVLVDYLVGVPSPKLNVPDRFKVTLACQRVQVQTACVDAISPFFQ